MISNEKIKSCVKCQAKLGMRNILGYCNDCRVQKWHEDNRARSREIKQKYVKDNPEKTKESWDKWNKKDTTKKKKNSWYDKFYFAGKRKILLTIHPYCCRCQSTTGILVVHHRDNMGTITKTPNNEWSNLIVLCRSCHTTIHNTKEYPYYVKN